LQKLGHETGLVFIKTEGDLVTDTPLPMIGGKGVFTKALDDALLENRIDMAVHSFKDIPTRLPEALTVAAVTEREDHRDVLVLREGIEAEWQNGDELPEKAVIATSSHRRGAQWLAKYPGHSLTDIRGNVHTRLEKLDSGDWTGAIFAAAGLKRVGLGNRISRELDWMLPAPAQGALAVMTRQNDEELKAVLQQIHDTAAAQCTGAERQFLNALEGGCSAPIGALATISEKTITLKAAVFSLDGKQSVQMEHTVPVGEAGNLGTVTAGRVLNSAEGQRLISSLKGPV
jgi:hydroxymethylbilane synthase